MDNSILQTLQNIDLTEYLDTFLNAGFCTSSSLRDISEEDFDVLEVKLGHRRRLQRELLQQSGGAEDVPLDPLRRASVSNTTGPPQSHKRKYRRHPKRDPNAPLKPLTAYAAFANEFRVQRGDEGLSFTELAKRTGEGWQNITEEERAERLNENLLQKEGYKKELNSYKQTAAYARHKQYLTDFKNKSAVRLPESGVSSSDFTLSSQAHVSEESYDPGQETSNAKQLSNFHGATEYITPSETATDNTEQSGRGGQFSYRNTETTSDTTGSLSPLHNESPDPTTAISPSPSGQVSMAPPLSPDRPINGCQMSIDDTLAEFTLDPAKSQNLHPPLSPPSIQPEAAVDHSGVSCPWTTVTADITFIEHLVVLYLSWEDPTFSASLKKAFLADFRSGRNEYCSAALVNAILALGCRLFITTVPPSAPNDLNLAGVQFYAEAERLLAKERVSQVTTIHAMSIMSLREAVCGRQNTSLFYSKEASRLAMNMQQSLGPNITENIDSGVILDTFWGAFAIDQMWALLTGYLPSCSKDMHFSSTLLRSEASNRALSMQSEASISDKSQHCFRELLLLIHESFDICRSSESSESSMEVRSLYHKYLEWYSNLTDALRLGSHSSPSILFTHIYYHFAVLLLLQPYVRLPTFGLGISAGDICAQSSNSITILLACYHQLYDLRHTATFLPYIILASGMANLVSDLPSSKQFSVDVSSLESMGCGHDFAAKALTLLTEMDHASGNTLGSRDANS